MDAFEMPGSQARWLLYADPGVAPLRRSQAGSITPITTWLLYADLRLAPLRRSRFGSYTAIGDSRRKVPLSDMNIGES
jgi:hypothetical protein